MTVECGHPLDAIGYGVARLQALGMTRILRRKPKLCLPLSNRWIFIIRDMPHGIRWDCAPPDYPAAKMLAHILQ